jgi:creatinine amidohydrolase
MVRLFDMQEVLYERLTPSEFQDRLKKAPIAYLPLGTLEWHSLHLPLGSDSLQSQTFFIKLAQRVGGVVLPPLFLGPDEVKKVDDFEYYGMDIFGYSPKTPQQLKGSAYWIPSDLFLMLFEAVLKQIRRAGFRIVVAHGHGPSVNLVIENNRKLSKKFDLTILTVWRGKGQRNPDLEFQYDHAAMNETSIMMALHPDLVHMENLSKDRKKKPLAIIGKDPRIYASAKLGEKIVQLHLDRMEGILKNQLLRLQETKSDRHTSGAMAMQLP